MRSIECVAMTLKRISENWNETEKAINEMFCPYSEGLRLNQISEDSNANLRHCNNLGIFGRLSSITLSLSRLCKARGCVRGLGNCGFVLLNLGSHFTFCNPRAISKIYHKFPKPPECIPNEIFISIHTSSFFSDIRSSLTTLIHVNWRNSPAIYFRSLRDRLLFS